MNKGMKFVWGLFLFFLAACSTDEVAELQSENNRVHISAQIEPVGSLSRAEIGVDGKGHFIENDKISLLYQQKVHELTLNDGQWTPAPLWDEIEDETAFSAFYPVIPAIQRFNHEVALNQQSGKGFEESDLLFADPVQMGADRSVPLKFRHLMSCLTVELKGNAYTPEQFAAAKIQVKGYSKIQVYENGTFGKLYDYKKGVQNIPVITFAHKGGGIFQAVLCPQEIQGISYGEGWWLKISIAGKEYKIADPPAKLKDNVPFNRLESGKNVTLTYSFYDKDPEFSNKVCWVHGLKNMPDPSSSEWKVFYQQGSYVQKHLPWNAKYGWYDCTKKDPAGPKYDDQNMCWAATSANMIHWWFDQNQDYMNRYLDKHPGVKIPMKYNDLYGSEVFQDFKDKFQDKGGFIQDGLNWFFLGYYQPKSDAAELINPKTGGYLKEVFGANTNMTEYTAVVDMKSLSAGLKQAFKKKQAIGFSILMPGFGSAHAMTIWGAKFDEVGNACAIYYTDNNDTPLSEGASKAVGLIAAKVGEYEGKDVTLKGRACLENSQGKTAIYIQDLILLNLRQEDWNLYEQK